MKILSKLIKPLKALLFGSMALAAVSCGNLSSGDIDNDFEEGKGKVSVYVSNLDARTLFPNAELANLKTISLLDGTTQLKSWDAYSAIASDNSVSVNEGEHTFKLQGYVGNTLFSDSKTATITKGENTPLSFNLKVESLYKDAETETGKLSFTLKVPADVTKATYSVLTTAYAAEEGKSGEITLAGNAGSVSDVELTAGSHVVEIDLYNGDVLVQKWFEYVNIGSDLTTSGEINLSEVALNEIKTVEIVSKYGEEDVTYTLAENVTIPLSFTRYSAEYTLPETVKSTKYVFGGWYSDEGCTTAVTKLGYDGLPAKVYVKWIAGIMMNGTAYPTIQAALDACTGTGSYTITLAKGTYNEVLYYTGSAKVLIKGLGTAPRGVDVIISEANNGNLNKNNNQRSILYYQGTGSLSLENLTIVNTVKRSETTGSNTQAEVIQAKGSGNVAAYNCTFKSHQDTIQTVAKAWFYDCYVEGDVDFIWCEAGSKVALYEKCTLVAVGDETSSAYIAAPKMTATNEAFKGLVVLNSSVKADCTNTTLFRNPWANNGSSTEMYNSVAYINTTFDETGKGTLSLALSGNEAFYNSSVAQKIIGWKLDETSNTNLKVNAPAEKLLSATDVATEFAGRNNIVNRYYDIGAAKYGKDVETFWDLSALATGFGWTVDADTSSAGNPVNDKVTYNIWDLSGNTDTTGNWVSLAANGELSDTNLIHWSSNISGRSSDKLLSIGNGATIALRLKGPSVVTILVERNTKQATATFSVSDGLVAEGSKLKQVDEAIDSESSFIYSGTDSKDITITFAGGNTYVKTISVRSKNDNDKAEVKSISVNDPGAVTTSTGGTLTATVETTYFGSTAVTWTIVDAGSTGANINATTGAITATAAGTIKVKATSVLDSTKTAEKDIVISSYEVADFATAFVEVAKNAKVTKTTTGSTSSIKYGSADETIATVDAATGEVTGVKGGFVKIFAYNEADTAKAVKKEYTLCVNPLPADTYTWTSADYNTYGEQEVTGQEFTYNTIKFDTTGKDANNNQARVKKNSAQHVQIFGGTIIKIPVDSTKATSIEVTFSANGGNVEKVLYGSNKEVTVSNSKIAIENAQQHLTDGYICLTVQCKAGGNTYIGSIVRTITGEAPAYTPEVNPVAGTAYTWDFLGENTDTYASNANGVAHEDGFLTYKQRAWAGNGHAFNTGTNDTLAVKVIGTVKITVSQTYDGAGWDVAATAGTLSATSFDGLSGKADYSVILTAANASAVSTVTFTSKGQNYASKVVVEPIVLLNAGWSWAFNSASQGNETIKGNLEKAYQGSKGKENGVEFDGTSGKIQANGDNIVFNSGSIIRLTVAEGATVVPVRYKNTTGNSNFTISERDAASGVVSITSNADNYLMGLMVVKTVDTTKNCEIDLGNDYTMLIQQHIAKGKFIELDMTSGKIRPNNGNAQINAGSVIRIPVAAGAVVDCTWYSGATSDFVDITYNEEHTEATITVKANQNPYIKTIKITYSN